MSDKQERTNQYIIYHKALERALSPLQARYDELCKNVYSMLAAEAPGLPTFFEALEIDSAAGSDAQPVERLANSAAIAVVYEYVLKALGTKPTETQNEREHAAQIMDAALPAVDIYTGTPTEIAARAKEYGDNWTYALYDTVLVSKTAKYERVRAYIRAIAPGAFVDSRSNVLQAANIQHTGFSLAYTMDEFRKLDSAKHDGTANNYTYSRAVKAKKGKKKGKIIEPAKITHVTYKTKIPENPEVLNGYTFKENDVEEIQRIWHCMTPLAKLYIEAIDNLLRRIDVNSPTAQIIWEDVNGNGLVCGKMYLTNEQIIREAKKLAIDAGISPTAKENALSMLKRLRCIDATIDFNDICPGEGCKRNALNDTILSFKIRDFIIKGRRTTILVFNSVSIFGQYVQQLQELTGSARVLTLPNAYLCNPHKPRFTDKDAILYRATAEWAWSKTKSARYYEGFYELLGDTSGMQRKRTREAIEEALNYYLTLPDCPFRSWEYWQSVEGDGIQIFKKKSPKQLAKENAELTAQVEELKKRVKTVEIMTGLDD